MREQKCNSAGNLYTFIRRIFLLIFSKFGDTTRRGRSCVLARCGRRVLWLREKALTVKQGRVTSRLFFLSWYETGYELQKIHNKTIDNRPTPPKRKKKRHNTNRNGYGVGLSLFRKATKFTPSFRDFMQTKGIHDVAESAPTASSLGPKLSSSNEAVWLRMGKWTWKNYLQKWCGS